MKKALALLIAGDLAAAALAYGLGISFGTLAAAAETVGLVKHRSLGLAEFFSVLLFSGFLAELYSLKVAGSRDLLFKIGFSLTLSMALLTAVDFFLPQSIPFQSVPTAFSLLAFGVAQFAWHRNFHRLLRVPGIAQKVMILGAGPVAEQIERTLADNQHNYILADFAWPVGIAATGGEAVANSPGGAVAVPDGVPGALTRIALQEKVDKIVISLTERRGVLPVRDILGCKLSGIEIVDAMSFYEQITGKLMVEKITPSWFIFSNGSCITPLMRLVKRIFDLVFAIVGLAFIFPLLPVIALAVKLDSPGPVFFQQIRVGMGEKNFKIYKFRTMRVDAESRTGAVWASENDPRITRVGRFLRKTRLDELPQLFNVLLGNMSLVGPRPERPEFVEMLKREIPFYSNRHYVKPGATGWAQVKYAYGASLEDAIEKLRYDLYYIKNYSIFLDFIIILETIKVVLFGRGAR